MIAEVKTPVAQRADSAHAPPRLGAPSRRRRLRRIAAAAAICALAAAGGLYGWQAWLAPDDAGERQLTETVRRGAIENTVTATGTLQPRDYVDVGAQVSGQLKKLHVEIGATVKAGDLLAEIDPIVYRAKVDGHRAQLRNLRAQLAAQEARHVLAGQQLTRQRNMMKEEATSAEALQTAEATLHASAAQIDSLKAQIQQTESQLRADQANLGYTKIYAPMAGTVVSVTAKQGQTLNASEQTPIILRIADLSTMTVNAQVSEGDVSKLREGMEVYFTTLGDNKRRWSGKLRQLLPTPQVVNNVVLYDALFDVPNPNQALMTQMTAQVFFVVAAVDDAVLVPVTALRPVATEGAGKESEQTPEADATADPRALFASGRALVHVVNGDGGGVEPREVKVGVVNRISAQIVSGLEPGEEVVAGTASSKSGGGKKKKKAAAQI